MRDHRKKHKVMPDPDSPAISDLKSLGALERVQSFCLYFLASRNKEVAAARAGYSGDLWKRGHQILKRPDVQEFLKKYGCDGTDYRLDITEEAVLKRLAEIASKPLDRVSTSHVIDSIKLIGCHLGLWEKDGMKDGKDRLSELMSVFRQGPVKEEPASEEKK